MSTKDPHAPSNLPPPLYVKLSDEERERAIAEFKAAYPRARKRRLKPKNPRG